MDHEKAAKMRRKYRIMTASNAMLALVNIGLIRFINCAKRSRCAPDFNDDNLVLNGPIGDDSGEISFIIPSCPSCTTFGTILSSGIRSEVADQLKLIHFVSDVTMMADGMSRFSSTRLMTV